jgi:hypothetical protein
MAPVKRQPERASVVAAYKNVLKRVVDNRPSGTRHRLAMALGKNRSFISQIASPAYSVPIPAEHLDTIFEVCHFTQGEKNEFLAAYSRAHPLRLVRRRPSGSRTLTLAVPDLGDAQRNRLLDDTIVEVARRLCRLAEEA